MTPPNKQTYDEGYDDGFRDAWREAKHQIAELEDQIDHMALHIIELQRELETGDVSEAGC